MKATPPRRPARPIHPCIARAIRLTTGLAVLHIAIAVMAVPPPQPTPAIAQNDSVAVSPNGWRRTADGWQRASDWVRPSADDLSQRVTDQVRSEPAVVRGSLAMIRRAGPLGFALGQVAFVTAIILIMNGRTKRVPQDA